MAGELQDYTVDQAAGAIALTLGALGSLLLVIWQSRCLCRCRIGISDQCYLFDCSREPPPLDKETPEQTEAPAPPVDKLEPPPLDKETPEQTEAPAPPVDKLEPPRDSTVRHLDDEEPIIPAGRPNTDQNNP